MKRALVTLWALAVAFAAICLIFNWRVAELEAMDGFQPIETPAGYTEIFHRRLLAVEVTW